MSLIYQSIKKIQKQKATPGIQTTAKSLQSESSEKKTRQLLRTLLLCLICVGLAIICFLYYFKIVVASYPINQPIKPIPKSQLVIHKIPNTQEHKQKEKIMPKHPILLDSVKSPLSFYSMDRMSDIISWPSKKQQPDIKKIEQDKSIVSPIIQKQNEKNSQPKPLKIITSKTVKKFHDTDDSDIIYDQDATIPNPQKKQRQHISKRQSNDKNSQHLNDIGYITQQKIEQLEKRRQVIKDIDSQLKLAMYNNNADQVDALLSELKINIGSQNHYYLKLKAFWLIQQKNYVQAALILKAVLLKNQYDLEANINMAISEIYLNQIDKAKHRLIQLKQLYPDHEMIIHLLSQLSDH